MENTLQMQRNRSARLRAQRQSLRATVLAAQKPLAKDEPAAARMVEQTSSPSNTPPEQESAS
jgi:hypothetical protein